MRDRLIELFREAKQEYLSKGKSDISKGKFTIDHLLYRGVIAPPCSINEIVYSFCECEEEKIIIEGKVFAIGIDKNLVVWISVRYENGLKFYHNSKDFGKTVFLTKEEAEKALRGEGE